MDYFDAIRYEKSNDGIETEHGMWLLGKALQERAGYGCSPTEEQDYDLQKEQLGALRKADKPVSFSIAEIELLTYLCDF